jgi:hypothetical protein
MMGLWLAIWGAFVVMRPVLRNLAILVAVFGAYHLLVHPLPLPEIAPVVSIFFLLGAVGRAL